MVFHDCLRDHFSRATPSAFEIDRGMDVLTPILRQVAGSAELFFADGGFSFTGAAGLHKQRRASLVYVVFVPWSEAALFIRRAVDYVILGMNAGS